MAADPKAVSYANAIVEIASAEGVVERVRDELVVFEQALTAEPKLRDALTNPEREAEHRSNLVANLLGTKAHPLTASLVRFVVEHGRARDLSAIIDEVVTRVARDKGASVAEVRSAVPLDSGQIEALRAALTQATGQQHLEIKVLVDPSIVGGLIARVGDEVYDASVKRRLSVLREAMGSR